MLPFSSLLILNKAPVVTFRRLHHHDRSELCGNNNKPDLVDAKYYNFYAVWNMDAMVGWCKLKPVNNYLTQPLNHSTIQPLKH